MTVFFSNLDSFYFFFFSDCCGLDFQNYRELCLLHHGVLNGREIQKRGDICICMAHSFCCTVETNTTLQSNYTLIKNNLKGKKCRGKCRMLIGSEWKSPSCVRLFVTPWTIQSMEFSRPEHWCWVAVPFSSGSFGPRNRTRVSCIAGRFFTGRESLKGSTEEDLIKMFQQCSHNAEGADQLWGNIKHLSGPRWQLE